MVSSSILSDFRKDIFGRPRCGRRAKKLNRRSHVTNPMSFALSFCVHLGFDNNLSWDPTSIWIYGIGESDSTPLSTLILRSRGFAVFFRLPDKNFKLFLIISLVSRLLVIYFQAFVSRDPIQSLNDCILNIQG